MMNPGLEVMFMMTRNGIPQQVKRPNGKGKGGKCPPYRSHTSKPARKDRLNRRP